MDQSLGCLLALFSGFLAAFSAFCAKPVFRPWLRGVRRRQHIHVDRFLICTEEKWKMHYHVGVKYSCQLRLLHPFRNRFHGTFGTSIVYWFAIYGCWHPLFNI
ncbi:unnamed protein product [Dicrocoelium dendriticum]|nr:unnamed protein product [Dicrocoelium dendriticum]